MIKRYPLVTIAYLLSIICFSLAVYTYQDNMHSQTWPYVNGEIIGLVSTTLGKNQSGSSMGYKDNVQAMTINVKRPRYRYTVEGIEYKATAISEADIQSGDSITVFYNPDNPQQSSIARKVYWHLIYLWSGFAGIFGIIGWLWYRYQKT